MTEADAIDATDTPATTHTLTADLGALGVESGQTLVVHSSLSRLGWVCGGAQAVVAALVDALGPDGTLVMPTHSTERSDPSAWTNPPVPSSWWPAIREATPAYDARLSPTRRMGVIVECFRHLSGIRRSDHPTVSMAACGPLADTITGGHTLDHGMGEGSPLARLYGLDASVLLLGVGHENNTSLHLAEYRTRMPTVKPTRYSTATIVDGRRTWVTYDDIDNEDDDFGAIGSAFAATGDERTGPIGAGTARLMRQRAVVDFAVQWMDDHRAAVDAPTA